MTSAATDMVYKWKVDGLSQFEHTGDVFHIVFRLPGKYTLTVSKMIYVLCMLKKLAMKHFYDG